MEIRFTPCEDDASALGRALETRGWGVFLFVLLLGLMFLVGIYLIDHNFSLVGWIWLAPSVVGAMAAYEVPRFQQRRAFRGVPALQGEIVFTLNENGTAEAFATGRSQVEWKGYVRYKETTDLFLLFYSPSRYTFLPKRAMSPQQIDEMRTLLTTNIKSMARV